VVLKIDLIAASKSSLMNDAGEITSIKDKGIFQNAKKNRRQPLWVAAGYTRCMVVCENDRAVICSAGKAQNADHVAHWRGFATQQAGQSTSEQFANHYASGII
jgi:hypothetical protein